MEFIARFTANSLDEAKNVIASDLANKFLVLYKAYKAILDRDIPNNIDIYTYFYAMFKPINFNEFEELQRIGTMGSASYIDQCNIIFKEAGEVFSRKHFGGGEIPIVYIYSANGSNYYYYNIGR